MKRFLVVLLLIGGLFATAFAQSGRRAAPAPTPSPSSSVSGNSGSSDSIPITRKPRSLPSLRGGGEIAAPTAASGQTQNQRTALPETGETAGEDEVVRVETQLVTIPVSIIDRRGNFITDLEQSNFKIFEDGKEQEVAYFSTTEQPFTVILMIDVSPSTRFKIDEIHSAATEFVRQLKENDRVMIIAFDRSTRVLTEPTSDRNQISKAIRRANFGDGTSVYDAVDYVLKRRLSKIEGRKAVVLFSDGVDTTSIRSSYEKNVRDAEETDAAFYTIYYNTLLDMQSQGGGTSAPQTSGGGLGGIIGVILGGGQQRGGNYPGSGGGTSRGDFVRGEQYLKDLADKTGGRKYDADSTANLQRAFYNIAEELRREYSLGYYPSESGNAGRRKQIKVRVNRPNLIVRARDSYIVGGNEKQPPTAVTTAPKSSLAAQLKTVSGKTFYLS